MIACNNVVYRASICKSYLTAVATTATEEDELKAAENAMINDELEALFEDNKYYQGKLDYQSSDKIWIFEVNNSSN